MENCPNCGLPVEDGAKFCANCGTRMQTQLINKITCSVCGNTLNAHAKFCNVCGTPVPQAEQPEEKVEEDRNPTMDSIEVPELHYDSAPVQTSAIPQRTPDMPTMDSVYLPGQEPVQPAQTAQTPVQPTAEEIAMASRTVNVQPTPVVQDTPQVAQSQPQPERILTPEGYVQAGQNVQNTPNANAQANPNMQYNQNPNMQNMQNMQPNQQMNGVTPGKGAGALVPIILIILIIAVICVDVFWLFRDQIFGKKDDKSSGSAVVTLLSDEDGDTGYFIDE